MWIKNRWIFSFLMFLPSFLFGQVENGIIEGKPITIAPSPKCSPIDFKFLNQNLDSVKQNSRLELGLTLPDSIMESIKEYLSGEAHHRSGLNPFVSWDIDIKAHFKQEKQNIDFTAIGFWYVEMNRNEEKNTWDRLDTKMPFRIRFAPPKVGKWEVNVAVYINGKLLYCSQNKEFTVISSKAGGNVTLNPETNYLERDGKTIIPIGVNLPFPYNKNNLLWNQHPEARLHLAAWEEYLQQIKGYVSQGGNYFRVFIDPSGTGIEFEEVGNYQRRQNFAWEMDHLIQLCEQHKTLIQLDILHQSGFMKAGGYYDFRFDYSDYWDNKESWPYKDNNYVYGYSLLFKDKNPSDMFLNTIGMRYLKQRTRYIMARWGYSPCISIIELMSEPWHMNENPYKNDTPYDTPSPEGDTARRAVYEYHKQISSYIKDSIRYDQHLLAAGGGFPSGSTDIYSHQTEETPQYIDSTWYLDNIDVINISYYSKSPSKLLISKSNKNNQCGEGENSMACVIQRLEKTFDKPVIFGESDTGDGTYECSDQQGQKIDIMRYPYTGAIGHYIWGAFMHRVDDKGVTVIDHSVIWPEIISAQNHFKSDDFLQIINNRGALGREKQRDKDINAYIVETGYILTKNKEEGAGYLYNRTFNINTAAGKSQEEIKDTQCNLKDSIFGQPIVVNWKPQRLKIEGLRSFKNYKLYFYGYTHHKLIDQIELRSTLLGKVKIKHPPLIPNKEGTPLIWYRIEIMK